MTDDYLNLNKLHACNPSKKRMKKQGKVKLGLVHKDENPSTSFPTSLPFFDWKEGYIPPGIVGSSLCCS